MLRTLLLLSLLGTCGLAHSQTMPAAKARLVSSVEQREAQLIELSDKIWALAEVAFEEGESAKLLANYAEKEGFRVRRGVSEMPT
ncbi:MAG: amidohydrolase, partial [Bacteroidota bacterium]